MELRHIRYFQAVAQTLNFTRAAERLNIAQPPLSRQIQQLEEHLGTALLERSRPLQLTEAGRFFYEQSDTLLKQLEQLCENTRRIGRGQRQWLGIGFAPSTLYAVLPELIRELRRDTDLELGLQEMTTLQQIEALKSGRIDIGFGRIHFDDAAIHQEVLREDPLVAVLPVGHHLIGQPITLERLSKERFVLYPANPRPSYADHVLALFANHGMGIQVSQWANELQTALGLVAAGLGITLVPASVQQQHRTDLTYARLEESEAVSPIILSRRASDISPITQRCLAIISIINR
ncbi:MULTISPECIES: LysR family transcriptional regulator [Pseudomonas putida group]|uniref:CatBC operon regulator n=2 Tax=Pseudomonas putida TaxID=303 RepID=E0X717_PSEPU|nr:LysR family transcriptional regulator [Pseudomonas putida]ADI95351.1 catBC operon regulator [Pseudomonas putida DOT-T1E]AFO51323.1 LysR family transcriptional regulator [Pseudomonas putida DOT-T1E]AYN10795.1 LysR family transcriptional regulator [Pseudomonas putida]UZM96033.1 LysR family transcriptional regulator [Pseudomonas putida DOT-T1E]